ncbi:protein rolling stone-like [Watersipora subatra]|uniref:protein rolling stone-like n=1 Tax=Watersipora subatra TaxID=2589382 RepID=UPI00355C8664
MSFRADLRDEFTKRKAGFGDCTPEMMYKSKECIEYKAAKHNSCSDKVQKLGLKFGEGAIPVMVYRLVVLIFSLTIFSVFIAPSERSFIYYTNWSYTVLILYFLLASIVSCIHLPGEIKRCQGRRAKVQVEMVENGKVECNDGAEAKEKEAQDVKAISWYMKIQWILYNVSLSTSILVTLIYWGVLFAIVAPDTKITFFNVSVHVINCVFMLIEQYIAGIPSRIAHVYHCVVYAFLYVIFSVIMHFAEGLVIYPIVLDWSNPGLTTGVVCGLCLFYFVAQFVFFLIYRALIMCVKSKKLMV